MVCIKMMILKVLWVIIRIGNDDRLGRVMMIWCSLMYGVAAGASDVSFFKVP